MPSACLLLIRPEEGAVPSCKVGKGAFLGSRVSRGTSVPRSFWLGLKKLRKTPACTNSPAKLSYIKATVGFHDGGEVKTLGEEMVHSSLQSDEHNGSWASP